MSLDRLTYIKLTRSLLRSEAFMSEKMLKVWVWCLIKANFEEKDVNIVVGRWKSKIKVKRGDFLFGRHKASEELNMKESTVYGIMKKLVEMENIKISVNNHYSVVTVCNYDLYQGFELYESTTNQQPTNTTNKEKNNNKQLYADFLVIFNETTNRKFRMLDGKTKGQLNARIREGFSIGDFQTAIKNCMNDDYHKKNPKYLTPEFITRLDKLQKYLNAESLGDSLKKEAKPEAVKPKTFFD